MDKREIESMIEFMYNKCLRCDNKGCKRKKENIKELEATLQKMKNEKLQEISDITGIKF